ncbi:hypothetical protein B0H17DRAFT_934549, partial [Mycena rosella]
MNAAGCSECGAPSRRPTSFSKRPIPFDLTRGTQLHELVNSNEPPPESEIPSIRSVVAETNMHLSSLDSEISRLRDLLKELEEERTAVSSFHAQNIRTLSPLRRMPPELLGEIFLCTLPSVAGIAALATDRCGLDMRSSPWLLTLISSHWRAVALATPSLWSLFV